MHILGTNHCGEMRHTAFKQRELFQYVLCRCDYAERGVVIFANQIKSEYCGVHRYVYIESITLENFIAVPKTDINSATPSRQRHAVFNYCFYLIIANMMLLLPLNTSNILFHCSKEKIINKIIDYNMVKY